MNVLALDTCTEPGSLALACGDKLREAALLPPGLRSTTLHGEIESLLRRHGLTTRDVDAYGVTSGPGSFTGVRLGLTAVKGLAEVHGKAVVPVSTLAALAMAAQLASPLPEAGAIAAILDARRGQVFGGVYAERNGRLAPLFEESVSSLAAFLNRLKSSQQAGALGNLTFCGIGLAPFVAEIEKTDWAGAPTVEVSPCLAGPLAQFIVNHADEDREVEAARADANYVRLSDAELFWKG